MEELQHQPSTHGTATDTSLTEPLAMTKPETTCTNDSPLSSGVSSSSSAQEDTTSPSAGPCIVDSQSAEQDTIPKPSNTDTLEHDCPLDTDTCLPLDTNDEQPSHTEEQEDDSRLDQNQVTHDESPSCSPRQDNETTLSDAADDIKTPTHDDETLIHEEETAVHDIEEHSTPDQPSFKEDDSTQEESGNESVDQQHEQSSTPREPVISQENEIADQQPDAISQQQEPSQHESDNNQEQEQMTTTPDAHDSSTSNNNNNNKDDNNGSGPTPLVPATPIIHPPSTPTPPPPPSSSSPEQIYQDGPLSMQHQEPDLSLNLDTRSRHLDNNQHDYVTHDDESEHTVLDTHRRVWEADRHASECRRCNRRFNFLVRRHHCRYFFWLP